MIPDDYDFDDFDLEDDESPKFVPIQDRTCTFRDTNLAGLKSCTFCGAYYPVSWLDLIWYCPSCGAHRLDPPIDD